MIYLSEDLRIGHVDRNMKRLCYLVPWFSVNLIASYANRQFICIFFLKSNDDTSSPIRIQPTTTINMNLLVQLSMFICLADCSSILFKQMRQQKTILFQSKFSSPTNIIFNSNSTFQLTCSFLSNFPIVNLFWLHNGTLIRSFISKVNSILFLFVHFSWKQIQIEFNQRRRRRFLFSSVNCFNINDRWNSFWCEWILSMCCYSSRNLCQTNILYWNQFDNEFFSD